MSVLFSSSLWDEGKTNKRTNPSTQSAVKLCQWVSHEATCQHVHEKGLSLKKNYAVGFNVQ